MECYGLCLNVPPNLHAILGMWVNVVCYWFKVQYWDHECECYTCPALGWITCTQYKEEKEEKERKKPYLFPSNVLHLILFSITLVSLPDHIWQFLILLYWLNKPLNSLKTVMPSQLKRVLAPSLILWTVPWAPIHGWFHPYPLPRCHH